MKYVSVIGGKVEQSTKDFDLDADNDVDAASEAYLKYVSSLKINNRSFIHVPLNYTLWKGDEEIDKCPEDMKLYLSVDSVTAKWYEDFLGYEFYGTPYFRVEVAGKNE